MTGTIVEFDRVGLRYGTGAEVLRDLDFRLAEGAFYFLTGPSGAGKSTAQIIAEQADKWAFFFRNMGLDWEK